MRIFSRKTLREFWEKHPTARRPLQAWLEEAKRAEWETPRDLQARFGDDVVMPNNRAIFNIRGNHYRLVVKIHYDRKHVYVRFIGMHREYDRIDALTIWALVIVSSVTVT